LDSLIRAARQCAADLTARGWSQSLRVKDSGMNLGRVRDPSSLPGERLS
jgi:hypothetical protein